MKIYAPNKSYSGITAGVRFVDGIGETEDEYLIQHLKRKGYTVEEKKPKTSAEKKSQKKDTKEIEVDKTEGEESEDIETKEKEK